jgi:iron complex transport system substrate-binding protein
VTIKSTALEMLLALGLGDRIVGRAFEDGPAPERWRAEAEAIPVLSEKLPSHEVVLEAEPDFVYGGWESNFVADGAGTRPDLAALGIGTYVAPAACKAAPYRPVHLAFDDLFAEIAEVGRIFGVEDRAAALIAEQRAMLAGLPEPEQTRTALWYSSGTKVPYVGGGTGGPQMTMAALGLDNIFGDIADTWTSASWEAVAAADPDVIVLVDAAWNPVAQKKALLAADPVLSKLSAVRNQRYLTIPFPASEPGVRSVPAIVDLAAQLEALAFDP